MDALVLTALGKALEKEAKEVRGELKPGDHVVEGEVTLCYTGTVNILEDETYTPTIAVPFKTALALFVRYAGITREAAMEGLVKAMKEAMETEKLTGKKKKEAVEAIRELADLAEAEERVREGLAELPKETRNGKVTVRMAITEIKEEEEAIEEAA
jgi:hypothetical protein